MNLPRKKAGMFLALCLTFFFCGCASMALQNNSPNNNQIVRLCILNDSVNPVSVPLVRDLVNRVSDQFQSVANVELRIVAFRTYPYMLRYHAVINRDYGRSQRFFVRDFCPINADIVIIFTNMYHELFGGIAWPEEDITVLFWFEHVARGLYGAEYPYNILKHELGHIFNMGHTKDPESFMQIGIPSYLNKQAWSDEDMEAMRLRRKLVFGGWRRSSP